ncbi:hypothetical protein BX600DRAFT_170599 [Xylariales sp. PMI_506]|nr:hypothetical protein BX600DRAFT_170599 [Xylariales sp. PMI_506]
MDMHKDDFSWILSDVHDVIRQVHVHRPRYLPENGALGFDLLTSPFREQHPRDSEVDNATFDDIFDFDLWESESVNHGLLDDCLDYEFWERDTINHGHSASKSDSSSMPELTSATTPPPSDEGGAPSPRDPEDHTQLKAQLKDLQRGDDNFTFPQRELKPKGAVHYNPHIQLYHASGHGSSSSASGGRSAATRTSLPSPPPSSESSSGRNSPPNGHSSRGKRSGPLKNGEEVAEVRHRGACTRCKYSKTGCNCEPVCKKCEARADTTGFNRIRSTAQLICLRRPFDDNIFFFQLIAKTELRRSYLLLRNQVNVQLPLLRVWFRGPTNLDNALPLSVVHEQPAANLGRLDQLQDTGLRLNVDRPPTEDALYSWATHHTRSAGATDFQSALDLLTLQCIESQRSLFREHFDLLTKVHRMRCFFKIWCQPYFIYQNNSDIRRLPVALHMGLRNIAKSTMKGLEPAICAMLSKAIDPKKRTPADDLALWIALMQLILMYREVFGLTEPVANSRLEHRKLKALEHFSAVARNLFDTVVNMFDVCFLDRKPSKAFRLEDHGPQEIRGWLENLVRRQAEFRNNLSQRQDALDQILVIILANSGSTPSSKSTQPNKRHKSKR